MNIETLSVEGNGVVGCADGHPNRVCPIAVYRDPQLEETAWNPRFVRKGGIVFAATCPDCGKVQAISADGGEVKVFPDILCAFYHAC